eukprot:SAG31_NODE_584_length_13886_cov_96.615000_3_plen_59_part_00
MRHKNYPARQVEEIGSSPLPASSYKTPLFFLIRLVITKCCEAVHDSRSSEVRISSSCQ